MLDRTARENLLAIADVYAGATGLSLATISRHVYGNQAFFAELRRGDRSITFAKAEELLQVFSTRWPKGVKWPKTRPISMRRPGKKIPVEERAAA